ncbi:MAG: hypothetical protein LM583_09870 [Desulfurococcaceae archaeon]|jgi:hypothetical protein|nr:hypothetical protein [Desulfurococcaceae archaeon]
MDVVRDPSFINQDHYNLFLAKAPWKPLVSSAIVSFLSVMSIIATGLGMAMLRF